jgi:large subunit ribosomal protein L18Ae
MARFTEYSILGRSLPTESEPTPKLYRMRIFAPNQVVAKSRFWYFLRQLKKVKKANGEIVGVNVVSSRQTYHVQNDSSKGNRELTKMMML